VACVCVSNNENGTVFTNGILKFWRVTVPANEFLRVSIALCSLYGYSMTCTLINIMFFEYYAL